MLKANAQARSRARTTVVLEGISDLYRLRRVLQNLIADVFTAILLMACGADGDSTSRQDVLGLKVEGGRTMEQFASDSALSIVMLMAASECLSCSSDLDRWIEIAREHLGHATLVLTSQPPAEVRDALIRRRLSYAVVHQRDEQLALDLAPTVLVFQSSQSPIIASRMAKDRRAFLVDSVRRSLRKGRQPAR